MVDHQKSRRRLLAVGLVAAVVVAAALLYGHWRHARQAAAPRAAAAAVPVTIATVTAADVPIRLSGTGSVQASQSVTVRVRVDGQLDKVAFTEGQDVRKGDLLATIDPRPLQAQLASAQAQKAHDEATLTAALKDLERYTTLVAQDSIQQQTLDTQKATVGQLKASVASDQAQIDNATVQLGYTTIRSPIDGRTGIRMLDAGNIVHAADANGLVLINQIDPIAVLFVLPEGNVPQVNAAIRASGRTPLTLSAIAREDGKTLGNGRLLLVNNQIDTATGTVQLKGMLDNPQHNLWPGQYVNVQLLLGVRKGALTVPESTIQRSPSGLFVYVVAANGTATTRPVKVDLVQDGVAVVGDGLQAGERVVTDGQYKLRQGVKVTAAAPAADASAARPGPPPAAPAPPASPQATATSAPPRASARP
ncbi:MAG TPA: efflux RND transporter periplasmic adaptor subunit [Casimicrobiaceae bacterium]